jgi:hypothetical protein
MSADESLDSPGVSSPSASPPAPASDSPSPAALDSSADVRALTGTLRALQQEIAYSREDTRHGIADIAYQLASYHNGRNFHERINVNAIDKLTAEIATTNARTKLALEALRVAVDEHEKIKEERQRLARVVEDSQRVLTQRPPEAEDEITGEHIKLRWSTIGKIAPVIAKVVGVLGVAFVAVWNLLTKEIQVNLLNYVIAHWVAISSWGVAGLILLATVIKVVRDPGLSPGDKFAAIIDALALVASKGHVSLGNTRASLPLMRSRKPPALPPRDGSSLRALLPLLLAPALFLSACAGAKAWLGCTLGQLPQAAQPAFPSIYQALTQEDGQAAIAALETIGVGMLPGQVPCIVKAIQADEAAKAAQVKGMRTRVSVVLMRNADSYLTKHPATACGEPAPSPKIMSFQRSGSDTEWAWVDGGGVFHVSPAVTCSSSPGVREISCRDVFGNEIDFQGTFRPATIGELFGVSTRRLPPEGYTFADTVLR